MNTYSEESLAGVATAGAIELVQRSAELVKRRGQNISDQTLLNYRNQSLVTIANVGRVEPVCMVGQDISNLPEAEVIANACLSMFAGYYIQAINVTNQVGGVVVGQRLSPFNPNNKQAFLSLSNAVNTLKYKLTKRKELRTLATEAKDSNPQQFKLNDDAYGSIAESSNMAVGKMLKVTLRVGEQNVEIPIAIRLLTSVLPNDTLKLLFTHRNQFDMNLKERWYAFKEGRLGFWKDLVLCRDLIEKYRKMAIIDSSGVGAEILRRESQIITNALRHDQLSVSRITNIAIISNSTLESVERELGGRISNKRIRDTIFDSTNLMLLVVVDPSYERATIYTHSIDGSTTLSYKALRGGKKDGSSDVMEIMKAYMLGASPNSF
jgi:hypothetical protein